MNYTGILSTINNMSNDKPLGFIINSKPTFLQGDGLPLSPPWTEICTNGVNVEEKVKKPYKFRTLEDPFEPSWICE